MDLPVTMRCEGRLLPAVALNISRSGMFVRSPEAKVSSDSTIEIVFDLGAHQRDLSARGRVTRVIPEGDAAGVGIEFTNPFSPSLRAIEEYLESL